MTVTLIRLHPALQSPAQWLIASKVLLLTGVLLTGALVAARQSDVREAVRALAPPTAAALLWSSVAALLLLPSPRTRAGTLAMTLPLSGRRLWLASLGASLIPAVGLTAVTIGLLAAADRLLAVRLGAPLFPASSLAVLAGQTVSACLFALALREWPRPDTVSWPLRGRLLWFAAAAALPGFGLILLRSWPLVSSGGCLAAAVWLGWMEWKRQPEGYLLAVKGRDESLESQSRWPSWRWLTMLRWAFPVPSIAISLATCFGFGILQAVLQRRYSEEDETGLLMAPMLVYVMLVWLGPAGSFLHRLDPLPVSRRALAAWLTLPVITASLAGYRVGMGSKDWIAPNVGVEFQSTEGRAMPAYRTPVAILRAPAHSYEIAWDGVAPLLRAPWGETHRAWQAPLWRNSIPVLYSPFSTAEEVGADFAAWEISRALEGVYGVQVPWQVIREKHLETDEAGRPRRARDLEGLVAGAKPRSALDWAVAPATVTLCCVSYLLLAGFLFGLRRAGVAPWRRGAAAAAVAVGLLGLYLIRLPLSLSGLTRGWILGGALSSWTRTAAGQVPGGAVTLWCCSVVLLWTAFEFAVRRLERADILAEPPRRFGF